MEQAFPTNIFARFTDVYFYLFIYYSKLFKKLQHPNEVMSVLRKENYWMLLPLKAYISSKFCHCSATDLYTWLVIKTGAVN